MTAGGVTDWLAPARSIMTCIITLCHVGEGAVFMMRHTEKLNLAIARMMIKESTAMSVTDL